MTQALRTVAALVILGHAAWGDAGETDKIAQMFNDMIPTNWTVSTGGRVIPIRGISNPIAQLILTETHKTLTYELSPDRTMRFQPTLILLAFPSDQAREIDEAVTRERNRSDYPPFVFCLNDQYVLVTSPGYVNRGLHTPEAEASLRDLGQALAKWTTVKYPMEPSGATNGSQPIRSETNSTPAAVGSRL